MVPVFDPSGRCCVGVFECSTNHPYPIITMYGDLIETFKKEGLKTFCATPPYKLHKLEKRSSVGEGSLRPLKAKCKNSRTSLSQEGIIEAAKNLYVSLKRKRNDQSGTNEEDKEAFEDPLANNRDMYLDENTVTVKVECADDMIKFHLSISSATFATIVKEIGEGFKLNPVNYKLNYLDKDGDWILMTSDKDVRMCVKDLRNLTSIVRVRLLP